MNNNNNKQKYIDLTNRTMFHNDCVALELAPKTKQFRVSV